MKVLIYQGGRNFVKNSGVGKAIEHQIESIENKYKDVEIVLNEKEDYDVIHINTILLDSYLKSR